MKNKIIYIIAVIGLVILGLMWVHSDLFAQENPQTEPGELPFIDRDGDGVNDFLQSGWGLRFQKNRKSSQMQEKMMEKFNPVLVDTDEDGVADTYYIDTDNDGEVDISLHDYLEATREERRGERQAKMQELVDTDEDGVPDTPLYQHLRQQFGTFDRDGDGKPDAATPEEIRQHLREMQEWRKQVQQRINQGLSPFVDEDGDGIPDNLPERMKRKFGSPNAGPNNE